MFGSIGPWELIVILIIALIIFGKRLPEVGRSLGKGIVEFRRGLKGIEDEIEDAGSLPPATGTKIEKVQDNQEKEKEPASPSNP
ncbi:MAG: twin-arginine translocase TatA/TatE family subunit [Planctomycetota bacterium]|nr:MAG: twin-arginine translocase TatA/TatE family subunit [Planctomycetota bacterium]